MPDYAMFRIARESACRLSTVRAYYAGRMVHPWCARRIAATEDRIRQEKRPR
jgi:hypothetical protein